MFQIPSSIVNTPISESQKPTSSIYVNHMPSISEYEHHVSEYSYQVSNIYRDLLKLDDRYSKVRKELQQLQSSPYLMMSTESYQQQSMYMQKQIALHIGTLILEGSHREGSLHSLIDALAHLTIDDLKQEEMQTQQTDVQTPQAKTQTEQVEMQTQQTDVQTQQAEIQTQQKTIKETLALPKIVRKIALPSREVEKAKSIDIKALTAHMYNTNTFTENQQDMDKQDPIKQSLTVMRELSQPDSIMKQVTASECYKEIQKIITSDLKLHWKLYGKTTQHMCIEHLACRVRYLHSLPRGLRAKQALGDGAYVHLLSELDQYSRQHHLDKSYAIYLNESYHSHSWYTDMIDTYEKLQNHLENVKVNQNTTQSKSQFKTDTSLEDLKQLLSRIDIDDYQHPRYTSIRAQIHRHVDLMLSHNAVASDDDRLCETLSAYLCLLDNTNFKTLRTHIKKYRREQGYDSIESINDSVSQDVDEMSTVDDSVCDVSHEEYVESTDERSLEIVSIDDKPIEEITTEKSNYTDYLKDKTLVLVGGDRSDTGAFQRLKEFLPNTEITWINTSQSRNGPIKSLCKSIRQQKIDYLLVIRDFLSHSIDSQLRNCIRKQPKGTVYVDYVSRGYGFQQLKMTLEGLVQKQQIQTS